MDFPTVMDALDFVRSNPDKHGTLDMLAAGCMCIKCGAIASGPKIVAEQSRYPHLNGITVGRLRAMLADPTIPDEADLVISFGRMTQEELRIAFNDHQGTVASIGLAHETGVSGSELWFVFGQSFDY